MILARHWLIKSHAKNYWGERYMTIRIHFNRYKIPFANFAKSSKGTNEYDDELEINQSFSSKGIYTNDSSEKEIGLYI